MDGGFTIHIYHILMSHLSFRKSLLKITLLQYKQGGERFAWLDMNLFYSLVWKVIVPIYPCGRAELWDRRIMY